MPRLSFSSLLWKIFVQGWLTVRDKKSGHLQLTKKKQFNRTERKSNTAQKGIICQDLQARLRDLGPVVWKPINANQRLKVNRGFHLAR